MTVRKHSKGVSCREKWPSHFWSVTSVTDRKNVTAAHIHFLYDVMDDGVVQVFCAR